MGRLTRYRITLALSLSCAAFCQLANAQANVQNKSIKKPTGSVSGHITVKGKPKAGIIVAVRPADFGSQTGPLSKAVTDEDGNYRITDLPSGSYSIAPVAPSLVLPDINSFGQRGKSLILSDGENVTGIDFSMVRGGVITGKVTNAEGRPIIEERINIVPAEQTGPPGRQPSFASYSSSGFATDDRGIYRAFGLPEGRYKVFIGQSQDTLFSGTNPGRPAYERVFYPDATNPDEATVVEVREGTEANNIDIIVGQKLTGFTAAGIAVDGETNQPLPGVRFGIQRMVGERGNFIGTSAQSDRLGQFRFENLTPGKYSIYIMPQPNSDRRGDPVAFEVVDQDVNGITLRTSRGASVTGTIVLEGTHDKTVQSKLAQLRLQAYVRSEAVTTVFGQSASINPDGSFLVAGLQAGAAYFQLSAQDRGLLTGFVIARVERDGVPMPRGLEVKSGEQISGVRILVVYGSGVIRGTIKIENGPLPNGARLVIRVVKPEDPSFMVRPSEVDARGRFSVEGLPAGTYEVSAFSYIPASGTPMRSNKQMVTVTEGSVTEVEPVIDLEQKSPPRP